MILVASPSDQLKIATGNGYKTLDTTHKLHTLLFDLEKLHARSTNKKIQYLLYSDNVNVDTFVCALCWRAPLLRLSAEIFMRRVPIVVCNILFRPTVIID